MTPQPAVGAVLGIDVGFSARGRTTCISLLEWDDGAAAFRSRLTGSSEAERVRAMGELVGKRAIAGIALDGPLTRGLLLVRHYRSAEAILSRGLLQKRGKPGQTSAPTGQQLHAHATQLANLALANLSIADASHWQPIHQKRIVEAFPNLFLAAMVDESALPKLSRDASDRYWELLVEKSDRLVHLIGSLLPGRRLDGDLTKCTHHEERAGVVCAVTALATVAGVHIAVGDPVDGDIVLPPASAWGSGPRGGSPWLELTLRANVCAVRASRKGHPNHQGARVTKHSGVWFS